MSKTTNIRQRKNGLWEGRYRLNGKQCAVYGQTKAEAKAKLAARMTEIEQGICIERTDLTLEEWGWEWLKTFKEGKIRHSTMDNYESDFRMHVVPYIGRIKLKDLTTLHIQRTYAKAQQNGLSPKSIRNIHGLIHGMLAKAQSLDMVRKNVSEGCELPVLEKTEMHTLSDVELRRFLDIAKDDPFYLMYYVDFFTGLRESELIGLTWDCIDFAKGTIRVYRQFVRIASGPDKGKMMFTSLKNHKERTIHPAPSVMDALKQAKEKQNRQRLLAGSSWDNVYDMVSLVTTACSFVLRHCMFTSRRWSASSTVRRFASTTFATPTPRLPSKAKLISKRFPYPLDTQPLPSRSTPTDTSATGCRKTRQPRWKNSSARCKKRRLTRIAVFRGYGKERVCGYGVGIQQHEKSRNPCKSKDFGSWSIADSNR